jgi:hypothetical protein
MENITAFFTAMAHGAALVYHDVLAVETTVANWTSSNPEVAALLAKGVEYATPFLAAYGINVPAVEVAASAVLSALKSMAAADATVPSIATAAAGAIAAAAKV